MQNNETQELSTINILSLFQTTKAERAAFVSNVITNIEDESVDPLKIHLQLKSLIDISEQLLENETYRKYLLSAAEKNGKKFTYQNAEFSIKEVGTKYNWENCDDAELKELLFNNEILKEKINAKQDFLKKVSVSGLLITHEETGETYKAFPPSKSSTTSVAVTLR